MSATYIPGVCNIGPAEIRQRRRMGTFGLIGTIILAVLFLVIDAPTSIRFFVFVPATFGAMGYLQTAFHFCVGFASKGLFNVSDGIKNPDTVEKDEYRKKDQQKALQIAGLSVLIGVAVTALVVVLP